MQTVLLVVHLMIAAAMVGVVLMQQSEGGALGIGGGSGAGGGFMTGRGTANLLTRATAMLAAAFFCTSILLTVLAQRTDNSSAFDTPTNPAATQGTTKPQSPQPPAGADATSKPASPSDAGTSTGTGADAGGADAPGGVLDALKKGDGHAPLPTVPQSR